MEDYKKHSGVELSEKEIVYSQAIKAGKRIYYLDVKKSRKDEMFLAITESKKVVTGEGEDARISFEKHKIFLYREDFEKFMTGLQQVMGFVTAQQGLPRRKEVAESSSTSNEPTDLDGEIKIDIDF